MQYFAWIQQKIKKNPSNIWYLYLFASLFRKRRIQRKTEFVSVRIYSHAMYKESGTGIERIRETRVESFSHILNISASFIDFPFK